MLVLILPSSHTIFFLQNHPYMVTNEMTNQIDISTFFCTKSYAPVFRLQDLNQRSLNRYCDPYWLLINTVRYDITLYHTRIRTNYYKSHIKAPHMAIVSDPNQTRTRPNWAKMHSSRLNRTVLVQFGTFSDDPGSRPFFTAESCWFLAGTVRYMS